MRIIALATNSKSKGASTYSSKLYGLLPAIMLPLDESVKKLLSGLAETDAEICHIQYEYSSFRNPAATLALLLAITFFLKMQEKKTVVTFHGVPTRESISSVKFWYSKASYPVGIALRAWIKAVCYLASKVIVHTGLMKRELLRYGVAPDKVVLIPHGSDIHSRLGVTNSGKILFWGFVRPSKGLEEVVEAVKILGIQTPVFLTIAGSSKDQHYATRLKEFIAEKDIGNIRLLQEFLSQQEIETLVKGTQVIVLPYRDSFLEVSGVLHSLATFGRPVLCSRTPRFTSELQDGCDCLMFERGDVEALHHKLAELLSKTKLCVRLGIRLRRKFLCSSWEKVAWTHIKVYENIIREELEGNIG